MEFAQRNNKAVKWLQEMLEGSPGHGGFEFWWTLHIQALGTSILIHLIPLGFWGPKPGRGCSSQPSLSQREPGAGEFIH